MRRLASIVIVLAALRAEGAVAPWMLQAAAATSPEWTKSASAVVLLDETTMTVLAAGDITTRHRRVVRVQSNAGREHAYVAVHFDGDTKLLSFRGWSIDPKGNVYEMKERDAVETAAFDGELFSDSRMKVLRLPGGDPGTVFAVEYEQRERPYLLQELWRFQEDIPVLKARLEVRLPATWAFDARWSNYKPVEPENGVWELRDIPAIEDEPRMPSRASLSGRLGLWFVPDGSGTTPQRSWNELATWYAQLAATRLSPTPEMQAKARQIAAEPKKERAIRALARFAQKDVRYVAVEIGIGGYQPHAAGDVFRNRYGDCKDKATLLKAMLREIGIESYYVLVHTTRGALDPQLPLFGSINHVILAIASAEPAHATIEHPRLGKLVLFDPTSTTTPYGQLPAYLQDSRGLLVTGNGGELIALPAHAADANRLERRATLAVDPSGTLTGHVEEIRTGQIASAMRDTLQPLNGVERTRFIESMLGTHLSHYSVSGIAIENLEDIDADLVIRYDVTVVNYAKSTAGLMLVRPRVIGQKAETIVDPAKRRSDTSRRVPRCRRMRWRSRCRSHSTSSRLR